MCGRGCYRLFQVFPRFPSSTLELTYMTTGEFPVYGSIPWRLENISQSGWPGDTSTFRTTTRACHLRARSGSIELRSQRSGQKNPCRFVYRSNGPIGTYEPGTVGFFLVERYVLYAWDTRNKRLCHGRVHHEPYQVNDADVDCHSSAIISRGGFPPAHGNPVHAVMCDGVSVAAYGLSRNAWRATPAQRHRDA